MNPPSTPAPIVTSIPTSTQQLISIALPTTAIGTTKDAAGDVIGGFTQQQFSQVLGFVPGAKVMLRDAQTDGTPHTPRGHGRHVELPLECVSLVPEQHRERRQTRFRLPKWDDRIERARRPVRPYGRHVFYRLRVSLHYKQHARRARCRGERDAWAASDSSAEFRASGSGADWRQLELLTMRLLLAAALAMSCFTTTLASAPPDTRSIPLIDQRGKPFRLADLHGRPTLVTFVATRCSDACPIANVAFARLRAPAAA